MNEQSALRLSIPQPGSMRSISLDKDVLHQRCIVGFDGNKIEVRPFTLLRSQVLRRMSGAGWKKIGITSPAPANGKSFIATNLAAAMSLRSDTVVYLLDLDFRRSSVAANLGLECVEGGLASFLAGDNLSLASIGRHIEGTNLVVFPTETNFSEDTADLLASERFTLLMDALSFLPANAVAICDMPPVLANDDAMAIMQRLDAHVLVIEDGISNKKEVETAERLLGQAPLLGTVLNNYDSGLNDPYGYGSGSGKYKKYYSS